MSKWRLLITVLIVLSGLALLEWWSVNELYGADRFAGPITGAALVGLLALLLRLMTKSSEGLQGAMLPALTAVVELLICVAVLGSFSAVAVLALPVSLTSQFLQGDFAIDFFVFLLLSLALVVAARGWAKYSRQSLLTSKAELETQRTRALVAEKDRELARSELAVLRAQIEPHFLWNTLAHVQFLTKKRPEDAERMTGHLIRFMRTAIPKRHGEMTTLAAEFEAIDAYLELMKIRMGSRLTSTVEIEEAVAGVSVPPLLVQTLVENAIKHGIEPKVGPATLSVCARLVENSVRVTVADDGVGMQDSPTTKGSGMGLNSVRERLRLHFGGEARLSIQGTPQGGFVAELSLPLATAGL